MINLNGGAHDIDFLCALVRLCDDAAAWSHFIMVFEIDRNSKLINEFQETERAIRSLVAAVGSLGFSSSLSLSLSNT